MNKIGCKNCPVNPCKTTIYRGSVCVAQREAHGLGDPITNSERIDSMTIEEKADFLASTPFNAHIVILYQASFSKFACKVIRTGEVMRFNPELAKQCTVSGNIIDDPDWRAL